MISFLRRMLEKDVIVVTEDNGLKKRCRTEIKGAHFRLHRSHILFHLLPTFLFTILFCFCLIVCLSL